MQFVILLNILAYENECWCRQIFAYSVIAKLEYAFMYVYSIRFDNDL